MMVDVIDAISICINSVFGDKYEIYTESIEQGFKEPCFFIFTFNDSEDLFLGDRYVKESQFCINYFSDSDDVIRDCHMTAAILYRHLEWLNVHGDLLRGKGLRYEIIEGVLNFYVNYKVFYYKTRDQIKMGDITQSTQIK